MINLLFILPFLSHSSLQSKSSDDREISKFLADDDRIDSFEYHQRIQEGDIPMSDLRSSSDDHRPKRRSPVSLREQEVIHSGRFSDENLAGLTTSVIFLGEAGVGKTCLIQRIANDMYDPGEATIGAHFYTKSVVLGRDEPGVRTRRIDMQLVDTAGQERYRSIVSLFFRNKDVAVVLVDLSNAKTSFIKAQDYIRELQGIVGSDRTGVILVGSKLDAQECVHELRQEINRQFPPTPLTRRSSWLGGLATSTITYRHISEENEEVRREMQRWADSNRIPYFEVSSRLGTNVRTLIITMARVAEQYQLRHSRINQTTPPSVSLWNSAGYYLNPLGWMRSSSGRDLQPSTGSTVTGGYMPCSIL